VPPGSFLSPAGKANAVSAVPPADAMNLRRLNSIVMDASNFENVVTARSGA
jgi:hypothetical protein